MREIPLTRGKVALVDDDDYESLSQHKWHYNVSGYASRCVRAYPGARQDKIFMHRVIAATPPGMDTDHVNCDTLDNRKRNLRIATHAENQRNRRISKNNTTGVKGVSWFAPTGKFYAQIRVNGKHHWLGYFSSLEEAATAYRSAATRLHGEFANINSSPTTK